MEHDFDIDALSRYAVNRFLRTNDISTNLNNTEDLLSEARFTAYLAIKRYDASKRTKISTFIISCVEMRLIDIYRKERRLPSLIFDNESIPSETESPHTEIEFDLTMKKILTEEEYGLFVHVFVEDKPISHFWKDLNRGKVLKCYRRILAKYQSHVMNHQATTILKEPKHDSLESLPT